MSSRRDCKVAKFIALEGLSGVGKTTIAREIAARVGGEFVRLTPDFESAKEMMTRPEHVDARMCLFISALLHASVKIDEKVNNGITVVVDGFIARTLSHHYGMGARISISAEPALRMPDFAVMLVCDEKDRLDRIAQRNRSASLWSKLELQNLEKIRRLYEAYPYPTVDTTRRCPAEIAEEVLSMCSK